MSVLHTDGALSAWAGFAVFIGYVAVFITTAAMLIDRNTE
jgi:hypothetical protein